MTGISHREANLPGDARSQILIEQMLNETGSREPLRYRVKAALPERVTDRTEVTSQNDQGRASKRRRQEDDAADANRRSVERDLGR